MTKQTPEEKRLHAQAKQLYEQHAMDVLGVVPVDWVGLARAQQRQWIEKARDQEEEGEA